MPECEDNDCGEETKRRVWCWHCGLYVCVWCWHHVHGCEPGHTRETCKHYKLFQRFPEAYKIIVRAISSGELDADNA